LTASYKIENRSVYTKAESMGVWIRLLGLFYVFLKIKIQCWKNHILSLVDFQKKFIYY